MVLNQKTVFVIHCILIYYKKKNSVPITMGIFSINQTEFTVQRAVYTYFFITNLKKFPWLQLQLISSHIWLDINCPISTKFRTRSREPVSFLLSFQTTYPYPSLPHYSSLSLPSSTICPSSTKYFMERNWKYLLCTAQTA